MVEHPVRKVEAAQLVEGTCPALARRARLAAREPGSAKIGQCPTEIDAMRAALQSLDRLVADRDGALDVADCELEVGDVQHGAGFAVPAAAVAVGRAGADRPRERVARLAGELRCPRVRAAEPTEGLAAGKAVQQPFDACQAVAMRGGVAELGESGGETEARIGRAERVARHGAVRRDRVLGRLADAP